MDIKRIAISASIGLLTSLLLANKSTAQSSLEDERPRLLALVPQYHQQETKQQTQTSKTNDFQEVRNALISPLKTNEIPRYLGVNDLLESTHTISFPGILTRRLEQEVERNPNYHLVGARKDQDGLNSSVKNLSISSFVDALRMNEQYRIAVSGAEDFLRRITGAKIGLDIHPKEVDEFTYGRQFEKELDEIGGRYDMKIKIAKKPALEFGNSFWKASVGEEAKAGIFWTPRKKTFVTMGVKSDYGASYEPYAGVSGNIGGTTYTLGGTFPIEKDGNPRLTLVWNIPFR